VNLTAWAIGRPVTVCMLFLCMIVTGIIGGQRLSLEFLPDIEFPVLWIQVPYRNATPEDVERRIVRPAEEVLATLSGIDSMSTTAADNGATILLRFRWDEDLSVKGMEARDKLEGQRDRFPDDVENILIYKFEAGNIPVLHLRISSERNLAGSYEMLDRNLKRRLERLDGVSRVVLFGVRPLQVRVELAADRVSAHGVDLRELGARLQRANFSLVGGHVLEAGRRFELRTDGRLTSLQAVRDLVIRDDGLRLGDLGEVVYAEPERNEGRRLDGQYSIGVNVHKETGANLVEVAERALAEVERIRELPEMRDIVVSALHNSADDVRSSLDELINAGLIGAALAFLVLLVFLRDLRMTLLVTAAVPLSLSVTLAVMYFFGYTLNILTLMGLMLSVGMLVDNAVVVTESVQTERAHHPDGRSATLAGTTRVALALIAGTATTMIVFLPNVFGEQNDITVYIGHVAVTICVSLGASLLVALMLIPQLTARLPNSPPRRSRFEAIPRLYARTLAWTLAHRRLGGVLIVLLLLSIAIPLKQVRTDLFPQDDTDQLQLRYNVNGVYPLAKMAQAVDRIEGFLLANRERFEIESIYSFYDSGRAESTIRLRPDREQGTARIRALITEEMPAIAVGRPGFDVQRFGASDRPAVQIRGESAEVLRDVAREAERVLRNTPGLTDVRLPDVQDDQEVRVRVDRDRARLYGLSSQEVAEVVVSALRGVQLRPYRTRTGEVDMVLEFRAADRTDLDALRALPLRGADGERVALAQVAELSVGDTPGTIRRENRATALTIEYATAEGVTADEARASIAAVLDSFAFPPGYGWAWGMDVDRDAASARVLLVNMLLAAACIYLVMAALFESWLAPSSIITGIVFSVVGVYWFFMFTGTTFSFMALIGILILMGIVVNNGIVFIDYVTRLRAEGMARDQALVQAGRDRLRPIVMTAATTVLGMVPLAMGDTAVGGQGPPYYPMARAIIGGLAFSTIVTLLVLPSIYCAMDDLGHWGRRALARARGWGPAPRYQ
jgi:HAE1 family hydrophobic/amphiphilic exporter-1